MTPLSNVCSASPVKNQIIFFDGHDSHFYYRILMHMELQNIQLFILKVGDSVNDQPNDNESGDKLKSLYNEVNFLWVLKYGTTIFYLAT